MGKQPASEEARKRRTLEERLAASQAQTAALMAQKKLGENPKTRAILRAAKVIEGAGLLGRRDADALLEQARKHLRELVILLLKG